MARGIDMTRNANVAERELSFVPVDKTRAKVLEPWQIDHYNEHGYFHPLTLADGAEVVANRAYVDSLFERLKDQGERDSYALLGYHTRCVGLYDIATSAKLLDVIEDIIGPDIICWTSQIFCKVAHDPKSVPFHQDASYWLLSPARTVSAWLAIDDSDHDNSCLQVIPGTHKKGHLSWSRAEGSVVLDQKIDQVESHGDPADIELKAGQFSIHADLLAHGSNPNLSARRRCGYVMRFCPPSVRPLQRSWGMNAVLCRGTDATGNWQHQARPSGDDLTPWASYWERKVREGSLKVTRKDETGGAVGG
jgi:hypothetical protein